MTELLKRMYPAAAAPMGRLIHGREPADIHGTFSLDSTARTHIEPLRRATQIPVDEES